MLMLFTPFSPAYIFADYLLPPCLICYAAARVICLLYECRGRRSRHDAYGLCLFMPCWCPFYLYYARRYAQLRTILLLRHFMPDMRARVILRAFLLLPFSHCIHAPTVA